MEQPETNLLSQPNPIEPVHPPQPSQRKFNLWWVWVLLGIILIIGGYLRTVGMNWDLDYHLHPDERFLTMVETSITPVNSLGDYFNTDTSTLNPNNRGYGFYVYGTLPLFLVRYVGEWINQTGYSQIHLVGRYASALFDLLTVLLVFLTAFELFRKPWLALLAALFSALSVLPIQLSHFFTVDSFLNFFSFLAFYFAVRVFTRPPEKTPIRPIIPVRFDSEGAIEENEQSGNSDFSVSWLKEAWSSVTPYVLFGVALGWAVSSKISAAPVAVLLPLAVLLRYLRLKPEERSYWTVIYLRNLIVAALVALVVFRIFQPYAFKGPGFFDIGLNPKWIATMKELAGQSGGDVDFPPALQWARRPYSFAWTNMVVYGLGLPLGVLAWSGFLWMGWRMLRGELQKNLILWAWTGLYFTWQSINFTRSMRYQLPVYPTLAIIAAWTVVTLWGLRKHRPQSEPIPIRTAQIAAILIGLIAVVGTGAWAFAFTHIYSRPVTRVDASQWIYQNVPGPINLQIQSDQGSVNQPLAFRNGARLSLNQPIVIAFKPTENGEILSFNFTNVVDPTNENTNKTMVATLQLGTAAENKEKPQSVGVLPGDFGSANDPRGNAYQLTLEQPYTVKAGQVYTLRLYTLEDTTSLSIAGGMTYTLSTVMGQREQYLPDPVDVVVQGNTFLTPFTPFQTGALQSVMLDHVVDVTDNLHDKVLRLSILTDDLNVPPLVISEVTSTFPANGDLRGSRYTFQFVNPVRLEAKSNYYLRLELISGDGRLAVYGSKQALESTWDDALPLGMNGLNPYDYNSGVYRSDLNFEMYWDDNGQKRDRFQSILDQTDYIFMSSNRQWGTTVRVPERYPLTTTFYRDLLGCPVDKEVTWCYSVAKPGDFKGTLGFELVKISQSNPNLDSLSVNTQFAEEAFTVYDAPKVMIFRKTADYDSEKVRAILEAVDLSKVVHLTPGQATKTKGTLMLPADRLASDQAGGTWSSLFETRQVFNQYPGLAAVLWYLVVMLLGWMMYPLTRLALRGLPDRGYPLSRLVGLLVLAFLVWLAGSSGISVTRLLITAVLLALLLVNLVLYFLQRKEIQAEVRSIWKYILAVEILFLAFFTMDLLIRLGNPDLWHAYKGGEKPMDFSYLNAVLKSTSFPPYDPWFAGGYINYYYYGFVIVGVLIKWLGIVPAIAYNLVLPTLFAMVGLGAFSIGWNLMTRRNGEDSSVQEGFSGSALYAGLASAFGLLVLGNLGTVRMIWDGTMRLVAPNGTLDGSTFFQRIGWTFGGLAKLIAGANMPYPRGDWYWIPSRAIPGEPITEFPFFTFLYADLHAHMIALPITVLAIAWALSILKGCREWGRSTGWLRWAYPLASLLLGGLVIGALRPTNTWDFPTYLALGCVILLYAMLRNVQPTGTWLGLGLSDWMKKAILAFGSVAALVGLSFVLYQPFTHWFAQGYNAVDVFIGNRTPFWSYITHWGLFLFIITSWMIWETIDWLAKTPVSALNRLKPYRNLLIGVLVLGVAVVFALLLMGVQIAWLALPLAIWAAALILRPNQPDEKRFILFLVGTALFLTLAVELVVLRGDLGRMNTVFKFYLQAWTMLALSAGASLTWLIPALKQEWTPRWRNVWQIALGLLVFGAALFPFLATSDKVTDRMNDKASHTLDGMAYMQYGVYNDNGTDINLAEDYAGIRFMQENITGSPVIVEANTPEYRWGSRFTIYTGLPGVVGWSWHQRQQRGVVSADWVTARIQEITDFYNTSDREKTIAFLKRYNVHYIIVGQLEQLNYPGVGLLKFQTWNQDLWKTIYQNGKLTIYEVSSTLGQ